MVNDWRAAIDNIGRREWRQAFKPEMGFLGFAVAEHPGLNDLIRLADVAGDNRLGILQGLEADRCIKQGTHEVQGTGLTTVRDLGGKPARAGGGQIGARRVRNQQIPTPVEHVQDVPLDMFTLGFGGQQVTADGMETHGGQGITDTTGVFAGDQGSWLVHSATPPAEKVRAAACRCLPQRSNTWAVGRFACVSRR